MPASSVLSSALSFLVDRKDSEFPLSVTFFSDFSQFDVLLNKSILEISVSYSGVTKYNLIFFLSVTYQTLPNLCQNKYSY